MGRRIQKMLSEFGIKIRGGPDAFKAEEILSDRRVIPEKHLTVFKKIEEKEAQLSWKELYLRDVAKDINTMEGISYEQRKEIKEVLKNKKLSNSEKVGKIRWVFDREHRRFI
jgi:hypothetical protein